jgi:hypothetical protein
MGWYGKIDTEVARDFNELKIKPAFTWNYKADFWLENAVKLSEGVDTNQLIQIWSEVKRSKFQDDPVDRLIGMEGNASVEHHVASLTHQQIQELEKRTDKKLMSYWIEAKEQQFTVHNKTFVRRGTSYFLIKAREEEQLTNFALDIKEIRKRGDDFFWCGFIHHNESFIPFEMNDKYFTSSYLFAKGVRTQFLKLGIGIPFINEKYVKQLLSMIQLTSYKVQVVPEEPTPDKEVGS